MNISTIGSKFLVCLFLLTATATAQRSFSFLSGNEDLIRAKFQPPSYELWSSVFAFVKEGDIVTIPAGRAVKVDVATMPPLAGLRVDGLLYFPEDSKMKLFVRTGYVLVRGMLRIGSKTTGMIGESEVTFELTSGAELLVPTTGLRPISMNGPPVPTIQFGQRAFGVAGGQLDIAGISDACSRLVWQRLARTVRAGATRITVHRDVSQCWKVGMEVAIAPSGYRFIEAEQRTITAMSGRTLTLNAPLTYDHLGRNENRQVDNKLLEFGAEVILLSRPIKIQSDSTAQVEGGHMMIAHTRTRQLVQGIEFTRMGQRGNLGRYPLHAHLCGSVANFMFQANAIHQSNQRGIVIHATNNVKVWNNVLFAITGHAIMVAEDHFSTRNDIAVNTVMLIRRVRGDGLLPFSTDNDASGIWIGNPQNIIRSNSVAGSERSGIWYEMQSSVVGLAANLPGASEVIPNSMILSVFRSNVVHSCNDHGVRFYPRPWKPTEGTANFADRVRSYRNTGFGMLLHAHQNTKIAGSSFYDNRLGGVDFDRSKNLTMINSAVVGNSRRLGAQCPTKVGVEFPPHRNPESLPGNSIDGVSFDGFQDCSATPIGIDSRDGISRNGWVGGMGVKNCKFLDGAEPIRMSDVTAGSGNYWDNDIAVNFVNSAGVRDGYFITNKEFLEPVRGGCTPMWGGLVCDNKCYRKVMILFRGLKGASSDYLIRIKRIADGEAKTATVVSGSKFYFTLEADQAYEVDFIRRNGAGVPDSLQMEMVDMDLECDGGVELRFNQLDYGMRFLAFAQQVRVVGDCGSTPVDDMPIRYSRCENRVTQTVVKINRGAFPKARPRGIRVALTSGTPTCPQDACP